MELWGDADFANHDIKNCGNITFNGFRILNQNGGDIFFSQTTGDYQYFVFTLKTDSSGTADQRGYVFTNVAYDAAKGLYISKLLDNKSSSSDIVRFNNAGGMRFYGDLDMHSNNITSAGTITGTTLTASDKITIAQDKPLIMGRTTRGLGVYTGGLELYGTSGVAGPHIQAFTTLVPNYTCFQLINNGHSNVASKFDCYWDGAANDKSSSATSNCMISKSTNLLFQYASGVTVGNNITFNTAMDINSTSGLLTTKAITTSGDVIVGAGKKIFADRSALANNKLILYDGGSESTTGFYGFGIAGSTLIYNVDGSGASHVFCHTASTELFRINDTAITASRSITVSSGISSAQTITMSNSTSQLYFPDGTTTTCGIKWYDDAHGIFCKRNTNEMYFKEYGTCYFQTTGSNTRATLTSSGIVNTSDKRHKTDIRDAKFCGLAFINALKPKCFKLRESKRENFAIYCSGY